MKRGIVHLLEIKDSDIRLSNLHQCRHAVDGAIHIGGAFSATIPMVSLFYGGIIDLNIEQPTAPGQDMFVLSKGHAVATLASIYADVGYFDKSILENSRSIKSILNGHPGPILPGVHVATGPMGQGMGVAQGLAIAAQSHPQFDVYAVTGDGELQEGPIWEAVMYAGSKGLENFCVMIDHNGGQLDNVRNLHFPYHDLGGNFSSFGWNVIDVDATRYSTVHRALSTFKKGERNGRPTVIICRTTKGHGGFSAYMNNHKTSISPELLDQESALHMDLRQARVNSFCEFFNSSVEQGALSDSQRDKILAHADAMGFAVSVENGKATGVEIVDQTVKTKKAPVRDKSIAYDESRLPNPKRGEQHAAHHVIEAAMKEFAKDSRVVSIDSDLASTSGLQNGIGYVDKARALNVGVAEANMVLIGEAFGIMGSNAWVSTFCPFFDWKLIRRIAVGHQERLEVIADNGWLSEGHGLDLTLLATAADLDTQANGATHMGNDDLMMLNEAAHIDVINVSCGRQLIGIMKWIMAGNKGMNYLRILRAPAPVIYDENYEFEFGKGYTVSQTSAEADAIVVSTGRGVHEALSAAERLSSEGVTVKVVDMPTIDEELIVDLAKEDKPLLVVDQNNGYLWSHFRRVLFEHGVTFNSNRHIPLNTTVSEGRHYIHSGTYDELAAHYGLDADGIEATLKSSL